MSSVKRALAGEVLILDLDESRRELLGAPDQSGRSARTLIKSGRLRVTQVVLNPGAEISEHQAEGPVTVQPLEGALEFTAGGEVHHLEPGDLLTLGPGVRHSVASRDGATFLLTVVQSEPAEPAAVSLPTRSGSQPKTGSGAEAWLRGRIEGIPPLLMPVAHALVQSREDLERAVAGLTERELWARPGGAASIGYHMRHLAGTIERLLTYARGAALTGEQLAAIKREGEPGSPAASAQQLWSVVNEAVEKALGVLRQTSDSTLLQAREVGRAKLPSNVLGLLFHAAEHTQRHTGQVITTVKILKGTA